MRRILPLLVLLCLALSVVPASASPPLHERFEYTGTFDPGNLDPDLSFGVPEICDFDYVQSWYGIANVTPGVTRPTSIGRSGAARSS